MRHQQHSYKSALCSVNWALQLNDPVVATEFLEYNKKLSTFNNNNFFYVLIIFTCLFPFIVFNSVNDIIYWNMVSTIMSILQMMSALATVSLGWSLYFGTRYRFLTLFAVKQNPPVTVYGEKSSTIITNSNWCTYLHDISKDDKAIFLIVSQLSLTLFFLRNSSIGTCPTILLCKHLEVTSEHFIVLSVFTSIYTPFLFFNVFSSISIEIVWMNLVFNFLLCVVVARMKRLEHAIEVGLMLFIFICYAVAEFHMRNIYLFLTNRKLHSIMKEKERLMQQFSNVTNKRCK